MNEDIKKNIFSCKIYSEYCDNKYYAPDVEYTCIGRIGTIGENLLITNNKGELSDIPLHYAYEVEDNSFFTVQKIRVSIKKKNTKLYKLGDKNIYNNSMYSPPEVFNIIGYVGSKLIIEDEINRIAFSIYPSKVLFNSFKYKD